MVAKTFEKVTGQLPVHPKTRDKGFEIVGSPGRSSWSAGPPWHLTAPSLARSARFASLGNSHFALLGWFAANCADGLLLLRHTVQHMLKPS
mmetsp:Transcript_21071/g.36985  ORF Transcript_21071/g.36985 Transcript_21071/m.36985 type:complete len:91 (+) Transcript_21071:94-366(+)